MDRFRNGVSVVIGSSSGIGEAISEALIKCGMTVVGLARRKEKLLAIANKFSKDEKTYLGKFHTYICNITQEQEIRETFASIKQNLGPISILINNAGVIVKADLSLMDVDGRDFDVTFGTNAKGTLLCAQEAIKSMLENNIDGHIVNINSFASYSTYKSDTFNLYNASKLAMKVLAEALREEILTNTTKIKITNIYPGGTKSEIIRDFGIDEPLYDPLLQLQPNDVANFVISILDTPATVLVKDLTIVPLIHRY